MGKGTICFLVEFRKGSMKKWLEMVCLTLVGYMMKELRGGEQKFVRKLASFFISSAIRAFQNFQVVMGYDSIRICKVELQSIFYRKENNTFKLNSYN